MTSSSGATSHSALPGRGQRTGPVDGLDLDLNLDLLRSGRHSELHRWLGSRPASDGHGTGITFSVWAPAATAVSVVGDWNRWQAGADPLGRIGDGDSDAHGYGDVWTTTVSAARVGDRYRFAVTGPDGTTVEHADPLAQRSEVPPATASIVHRSEHRWGDGAWLDRRRDLRGIAAPISIYEVHLGSWRRDPSDPGRDPDYLSLAPDLAAYVTDLGFSHVELMPPTGHPFGGSWGYQVSSYFAPTARWGDPDGLRALIDHLHRAGIGVIVDWVPAHFPKDPWALARFDGTALYEHADPRRAEHPDWGTYVFDLASGGVRSFLLSSARFWLEEMHADGLRVDAVASMLYLDYSRADGEWEPNPLGGREDLDAVSFLRDLNEMAAEHCPDALIVAEESTAWPGVTAPVTAGGLGFALKWNLGWMHDTLGYLAHDPVHRSHHHGGLTFGAHYAFDERFVLPLSHDEVVHGKGSLLGKMPGDRWQRLANLRALFGWMWAHPGHKLLFMGGELAQEREWDHDRALDWELLTDPAHRGVRSLVGDLNRLYRTRASLWSAEADRSSFEWLVEGDAEHNVAAFLRVGSGGERLACVANFSPVVHHGRRIGLPVAGPWREILNTDAVDFGGSGVGNLGSVIADGPPADGQPASALFTLPPLAVSWFEPA